MKQLTKKELPESEGNTIGRIAKHVTSGMANQEFYDIIWFLDRRKFIIVISG